MNELLTKFSGWFLLLMLAMLLVEILAVGVLAAGWCLHTLFGHYAIAVIAGVALMFALIHHHYHRAKGEDGQYLGGH